VRSTALLGLSKFLVQGSWSKKGKNNDNSSRHNSFNPELSKMSCFSKAMQDHETSKKDKHFFILGTQNKPMCETSSWNNSQQTPN